MPPVSSFENMVPKNRYRQGNNRLVENELDEKQQDEEEVMRLVEEAEMKGEQQQREGGRPIRASKLRPNFCGVWMTAVAQCYVVQSRVSSDLFAQASRASGPFLSVV